MKINRTVLLFCLVISLSACGNPPPTVVAEPEEISQIEEIPFVDEGQSPLFTRILSPSDGDTLSFEAYLLRFEGASFFGITEFEVRVDNIVLGNVPATYSGSGGMTGHRFYGEMFWTPQSKGTHLIAVRARGGSNLLYTSPDEVEVTVMHAQLEAIGTPPYLLNTPTPTVVSPMPPFYAQIMKLSLCWVGPGNLYDVISSLQPGIQVEVLGTGETPGYLVVNNPRYRVPCWVEEEDVDTGDLDLFSLPVFKTPPLPTKTPPAPELGCLVPQAVGAGSKCEYPCPDPKKYPDKCQP